MACHKKPAPFETFVFAVALALCVPLLAGARDPVASNLTGSWVLDVAKSHWGQMQKPQGVIIEIGHSGTQIHYSGWVVYANETTREFTFDGAVDGKEYPVTRSYGAGKMILRRKGESTFHTVYQSDDGLYEETARMVLSIDGKQMMRYMNLKSPIGSRSWTEVYHRKP